MSENKIKKGGVSVETAHIFPIIKKWLYSEKDIFLREIVSNATDAITKLKRLSSLGEYDDNGEKYSVVVTLDKDAKTITVSDNGIGMTEEELEKYICSIALSGALDFIQKYDDNNQNNGIIGHFGLGFYSSFMVSDKVEVITRSYISDSAVHFTCDGAGEYEIEAAARDHHGTDVIMHITDAWVEDHGVQNPAIYDCFPKFLKFSLCGTGDSMPNTIRKMSGAVADRFSIRGRGYIKPGYYADLTVFDEEKLRNGEPDRERSFGIEKVYINGVNVLDNEVLDAESIKHSGRAIRV